MSKELIHKKLEQMRVLLAELKGLSALSFSVFNGIFTNIRAAERNFQLLVELASDINAYVATERQMSTPETYRESFKAMEKFGIVSPELLKLLTKSANLRNILIHEYDFDEDNFIFYNALKELLPAYEAYIAAVLQYTK